MLAVCAAAGIALFLPGPLQRQAPAPPVAAVPRITAATSLPASSVGGSSLVPTPCSTPKHSQNGAALIEAIIDETGRIESACIVISVSPVFDRTALEAVRKQPYKPGVHEGKPAKTFLTVSVVPHPSL